MRGLDIRRLLGRLLFCLVSERARNTSVTSRSSCPSLGIVGLGGPEK